MKIDALTSYGFGINIGYFATHDMLSVYESVCEYLEKGGFTPLYNHERMFSDIERVQNSRVKYSGAMRLALSFSDVTFGSVFRCLTADGQPWIVIHLQWFDVGALTGIDKYMGMFVFNVRLDPLMWRRLYDESGSDTPMLDLLFGVFQSAGGEFATGFDWRREVGCMTHYDELDYELQRPLTELCMPICWVPMEAIIEMPKEEDVGYLKVMENGIFFSYFKRVNPHIKDSDGFEDWVRKHFRLVPFFDYKIGAL